MIKVKVSVNFDVEIPIENATDEQIKEWLRFEFKDNGSINCKNPLEKFEAEPIFGTFDWKRIK